METKTKKNIKIAKVFNLLFQIIILLYFVLLLRLITPQRQVDPDFFQFLRDSKYYLRLELPPLIQSLPANPILIGVFSKLFSDVLTEIEIALLINAISMSTAIYVLYSILKREKGIWHAGLGILFLITNPIIFDSAISSNSEVLFTAFSLLIFYLIWKNKTLLASCLSALGILIRYESILLFLSLILIDFLDRRDLKDLLKKVLIFLIPAMILLSILMTRNPSNSFFGTPFLVEVSQRSSDIPELRFIINFPFAFFYKQRLLFSRVSFIKITVAFVFYLLVFFLQKNNKKSNNLIKSSLLFTCLFLIFHTFFPAYLERYFVPALFSFVLSISLSIKNSSSNLKKVFIFILLIIITTNFWKGLQKFFINEYNIFYSHDYFTAQSIKNKITIDQQKYIILSPYPETLEYYYSDRQDISLITVEEIEQNNVYSNLADAIAKYEEINNIKILIPYNNIFDWGIHGKYDNSLRKWYETIGLYRLGDFINSDKSCLWYEEGPSHNFTKVYILCP